MTRVSWLLGASLILHGALALGVRELPSSKARAATSVTLTTSPKRPPPSPPPEAPPPPPPTETPAPARAKAAPPKAQPQPEARAPAPTPGPPGPALPDFGLALGNSGEGGVPVGSPAAAQAAEPAPSARPAPRAARTAPAAPPADDCTEPVKKPQADSIPTPAYTDQAREAKIEGRVRVEIHVDDHGTPTQVTLLQGLGHGLDESALSAARRARFHPATRCGVPVAASFVLALRFAL